MTNKGDAGQRRSDEILLSAWSGLLKSTSYFMFVKDADLTYVDASQPFAELAGLSSPRELVGLTDFDIFTDRELAERYTEDDRKLLESGTALLDYIEPIPPKNGLPRYSSTSKYVIRNKAGEPVGIYAIGRDVTREYEARLGYERELDFLAKPRKGVLASILYDITDWRVVKVYSGADSLAAGSSGGSMAACMEHAVNSVVEDEDVRHFFKTLTPERLRAIYDSGRRMIEMEYLRFTPAGDIRWVRDEARFLNDPDTGHIVSFVTLSDIDDTKRANSELELAAERDSMTGVLNHDATVRHIERFLKMEGINGTHAIFMIDVDDFKLVNDKFGHQMGDDVITDVAAMIKKTFRDTDIVGRVGGDEFMVLMKNVPGRHVIAKKAAELTDALQYDISAGGEAFQLTASVGIGVYKGDSTPFNKLYAEADAALYRAKANGKDCFAFADPNGGEEEGLSPSDGELSSAIHLRTLLDDIDGGVIVCEAREGDIDIIYASPSMFRAFNRRKGEIGENIHMLFSTILPEDWPAFKAAALATAESGVVMDCTYRVLSNTGNVEWRHARGSRLPDGGGPRRIICVLTDITGIKKTEEDLKFAELRNRTALKQSPAMLWEVDLRTNEMRFSGFGAEEIGYGGHVFKNVPESLIAERHIRSDFIDEFRRMFANLYAGDDSGEYYLMSMAPDGEYAPVKASFQLLRDMEGKPYYAIGIREPRSVSMELALYRTLNESGVYSVLMDDGFTILYGNDRYYTILGYTRESLAKRLGNQGRRFIHPDDVQMVRGKVDAAISSGKRHETWIMRVITESGDVRYTQTGGEFVKRPDGQFIMNGVAIDVTERVQSEQILKQQKIELDTLLYCMPGGLFAYSAAEDEQFTFISENMLKMLGYTRDGFVRKFENRFSLMVWHEDRERVIAEINEQIADSDFDKCEYRIETGDGSLKWVHDVGHLVVDEDGKRWFYVVIVDITAQKEAEAALRRQRDEQMERYQRVMAMRDRVDDDVVGSFSLNLTQNMCGGGYTSGERFLEFQEADTVDGFFEYDYSRNADLEQLKKFRAVFNRESLLDAFRRGENTVSFDHKFMLEPDRQIWLRTNITMAKNPETGDVEAYLYAKNIDSEKTTQMLIDKFVDIDYEFAILINVRSGIISIIKMRDGDVVMPPPDHAYYPEALNAALAHRVVEHEASQALEALGMERIIAELETRRAYTCSFSLRTETGRIERKQWSYMYLDGDRGVIACTRRDVTDVYASETDLVSGLYNRTGFCKATRELLCQHPETEFFISRMDIDHFKAYNDIYGKEAGDKLLAVVGDNYRRHAVQPTTFGRLEGDHFVACVPTRDMNVNGAVATIAEALHREQPEFGFAVRCGVYVIKDRDIDVNIMCDRALMALRSTKGRYDAGFACYEESMREDMLERQEIISSMKPALENGEFGVYLQPQYNQMTGRIVGVEALARWFRNGGVETPGKFIPIFEENGFIMQLDEYIWEHVCQLIRKWLDEGRRVVPVSVNVSRLDIYNTNMRVTLNGLMKKYRLSPDLLRLEITETAYMQDPAQLMQVVKGLREDGFFIEMDDFGSGYSSLNMLKDVIVDKVKLDMKFLTASAMGAGRGGLVLNAVVRLAHWLNIPVVAEGVETSSQADYLRTIGCTQAQGYLYARPMPSDDFERLLTSECTGPSARDSSIASFFNNKEFWDVESQATVIFNTFVGSACIVEYRGDGSAEILRANDRFFEETGAPGGHYGEIKNDIIKYLFPDDLPELKRAVGEAIETGKESACETRWNWSRDWTAPIWLEARMRVIAVSADRYVFYVTHRNTTRRKLAEETLRAREEELSLAISQTGRIICRYDIPTRTLTVPEDYAKKRGVSIVTPGIPETALGIAQGGLAEHRKFYESILRGEKSGKNTVRVKNADGSYSWERASYTTVFDENGAPLRAVIIVEDVSAEMERRVEDERNRILTESLGSLIFDYDYGSDTLEYKVDRKDSGFMTVKTERYLERLGEQQSIIHPDYIEAHRDAYLKAAEKPGKGTIEYVANIWGTGYSRCRCRYVSIADESGRVYRAVGVVKEIAEKNSREAE